MVTRNGVYYDLKKSCFKCKPIDNNLTFVFSSDLHLVKFEEQYKEHRAEQELKFTSRYRFKIRLNTLFDLILYKRIENRGFLVINDGGEKICQENLQLDGEKVMLKK